MLASTSSFAATQTWDLLNGNGSGIENNNAHDIGYGTYIDMTVGGIEVVASAWSSTGEGTCGSNDSGCKTYDSDPFIQRANLTKYNGYGLGAINQDEGSGSPDHSFDNTGSTYGADYDMMLLQFDTAVVLEEIDIGWRGSDSDISILGYTGSDDINGVPFGGSDTWSSLLNDGWGLVNNLNNTNLGSNQVFNNYTNYYNICNYKSVFFGTPFGVSDPHN